MSLLLQMQGCEVQEAFDGATAVEAAVNMRPDAIVMDISMPNVGGIEAAAILRRVFSGTKMPRLVAVSGFAAGDSRGAIFAAGFDACLDKPATIAQLVLALRA